MKEKVKRFIACLLLSALQGGALTFVTGYASILFNNSHRDGYDYFIVHMAALFLGPVGGLVFGVLPAGTIGGRPMLKFMGCMLAVGSWLAVLLVMITGDHGTLWPFWTTVMSAYLMGWIAALAMVRT